MTKLFLILLLIGSVSEANTFNLRLGVNKTKEETVSNAATFNFETTKLEYSLGYEFDINDESSVNSSLTLLQSYHADFLVLGSNYSRKLNDKFNMYAGLNLSQLNNCGCSVSITDRTTDLGYQLGASYSLNDSWALFTEYKITNNKIKWTYNSGSFTTSGTDKIQNKSLTIGLFYNF